MKILMTLEELLNEADGDKLFVRKFTKLSRKRLDHIINKNRASNIIIVNDGNNNISLYEYVKPSTSTRKSAFDFCNKYSASSDLFTVDDQDETME